MTCGTKRNWESKHLAKIARRLGAEFRQSRLCSFRTCAMLCTACARPSLLVLGRRVSAKEPNGEENRFAAKKVVELCFRQHRQKALFLGTELERMKRSGGPEATTQARLRIYPRLLLSRGSGVRIPPGAPSLIGPARTHVLHTVPKTWVTPLDRRDFPADSALA
jgi:hypothetical protein